MPLNDAIEEPRVAERTSHPIAVFSNSYARLPEHFSRDCLQLQSQGRI